MSSPSTTQTQGRAVRNSETNLGDLCADAYRAKTGADIAIINGGGVRANIAVGDITYGNIIDVQPFGNSICVIEATGQQILDCLELGAIHYPEEDSSFIQVSGLTYQINAYIPSSVKTDKDGNFLGVDGEYRVSNVFVGDEPLDLGKTYTVASHDYYLISFGNGMTMFRDCPMVAKEISLDNQALIDYITDDLGGTVGGEYSDPRGSGRITVVNESPETSDESGTSETSETTGTSDTSGVSDNPNTGAGSAAVLICAVGISVAMMVVSRRRR